VALDWVNTDRLVFHLPQHVERIAGMRGKSGAHLRRRLADQPEIAIDVFRGADQHAALPLFSFVPRPGFAIST
jgi:hypothetical protein